MSDQLLADFQEGATQFQMRQFNVIQTGVTPWGQYVQAMRELKTRRDVLELLTLQQVELDLRIAKDCHWPKRCRRRFVPFGRREHLLRMTVYQREGKALKDQLATTRREELEYRAIVTVLKEQIGEVTPERRHELDVDKWVHDVARRAYLDKVCTGALAHGTAEILYAAPMEWTARVLAVAGLSLWLPCPDKNGKATTVRLGATAPIERKE